MMVDNYHVVHAIHLLPPIKPRSMSGIVPRFKDLNESPINEPNTTLELEHMLGKNCIFLLTQPSNLVTNHFINAEGDENYIITYNKFALVPHEGIIHAQCEPH
jgi:hypothetical protein